MIGLDRSFGVAAGASERNWRTGRRPNVMNKDKRTAARGVTFAAFLCAAVLASHDARAQMMSLPGTFNVTESGGATYSIPISVPPGTAGMVPSLSIDYNSHGGNGLLGMGWSLSGLPSIGRCPRTLPQDGVRGAVKYDMDDRFCMEGQRLVLVSGTYGAANSEYRTELEGFSKITAKSSAGNGPAWFEVRTKSGQTMEFGNTTDSRFLAQGKTTARGWGVNKITDAAGNYLTVTYQNDTSTTGEAYPLRIDYTGNTAASLTPYNSVRFEWEARLWGIGGGAPILLTQYHRGSAFNTTKILGKLKLYEGSNLVGEYRFTYGTTLVYTQRQVLQTVRYCDVGGVCLPATTLSSTPGVPAFALTAGAAPLASRVVQTGDFNGDGRTDLIFCSADATYLRCTGAVTVWLSNGDGTFTSVNGGYLPTASRVYPGDFNGDGKTDLFICAWDGSKRCLSTSPSYLWQSNGNGTFTFNTLPNPPIASSVPIVGDFNGNGLSDIYFCTADGYQRCSGSPRLWLSTGSGSFNSFTPANLPFGNATITPGDYDGDGKVDLFFCSSDTYRRCGASASHVQFSNGDGTFSQVASGNVPVAGSLASALDTNGDGKTDIFFCNIDTAGRCLGSPRLSISKGDGTFVPMGFPLFYDKGVYGPVGAGDFVGKNNTELFFCDLDAYRRCKGNSVVKYSTRNLLYYPEPVFGLWLFDPLDLWSSSTLPAGANYLAVSGDFIGNGQTDVWLCRGDQYGRCTNETSYLWTSGDLTAPPPDLLSSFTTGLGITTEISYRPLTDGAVHTKGTGSVYPVVDVQAPMHVVARVDADDGIGGTYSSEYRYEEARVDLEGRGFLGFRRHVAKDLETGVEQVTEFLQSFPRTGLAERQTKKLGTQVLNEIETAYTAVNLGGTRHFVAPSQTVEESFDLDGSPIPAVTTSYQYDAYGNATEIVVSTPDGASKTTVNTYTNNATNWRLGRLTRTEVTSTVP